MNGLFFCKHPGFCCSFGKLFFLLSLFRCFQCGVDLNGTAAFIDYLAFPFRVFRWNTIAVVDMTVIIDPFEGAFTECSCGTEQCRQKQYIAEILHV